MGTFKRLKAAQAILCQMPAIKSCKDFDITIEIGYYQENGKPLSLKQLLLLKIASDATVRRHITRLVRTGAVIRHISKDDRRSIHLTLSKSVINSLDHHLKLVIRSLA
jgi:hypothetical protein